MYISILTLLGLSLLNSTAFAETKLYRCETIQAAGFSTTYNEEQTIKIRQWVANCSGDDIDSQLEENVGLEIINADTSKTFQYLYPVLGVKTRVDDPGSITGKRTEYSNPAGYNYNLEAIMADPLTAPCDIPEGYSIIGYCGAGCFTPDQQLLFPQGFVAIGDAQKQELKSIITLDETSNMNRLNYVETPLRQFVTGLEDRHEEILVFTMATGTQLKVTKNHPLIDKNGKMQRADSFKVGSSLVDSDGYLDPIVSIKAEDFYGKVINVDIDSTNLNRNIIVAQGYLNGSFAFQNSAVNQLNRILLRRSLIPTEFLK